jgi:hypothetical protein
MKEEDNCKQVQHNISELEDLVREQITLLRELVTWFTSYVTTACQMMGGDKLITRLEELPAPKRWDLILLEVDIQFEDLSFKLILEDIRNLAMYKIASALDSALIPLTKGFSHGLRWQSVCDSYGSKSNPCRPVSK